MSSRQRFPKALLDRTRAGHRIVHRIASNAGVHQGDIDAVAALLTECVARELGIGRVSVWLFDDDLSAVRCRDLYLLEANRHQRGEVLDRAVYEREFKHLHTERYLAVDDPYQDPRTQDQALGYLAPNRITAILDAVVRIGEEMIGCVCLERTSPGPPWSEDDILLATQLGDQMALVASMARQRRIAEALRLREAELEVLNLELEQRVEERTRSLDRTRSALLDAEKMAALGRMVAGVAHEMNTPIGNALLIASTLAEQIREARSRLEAGTLGRRYLAEHFESRAREAALIEHSLVRAAELVRNFKDLSLDQTTLVRRRYDLRGTVEQTLSVLAPRLRRACVQVELDIPEALELDGFPGPMEQIIDNLTLNSIVHGFESRGSGRIRILARREGDAIRIEHQDDGIGIPAELRSRIFEPFFTTRLGTGGSGIGLAVVYQAATRLFGGRIDVDEAPGGGARFTLRLPLRAPDAIDQNR